MECESAKKATTNVKGATRLGHTGHLLCEEDLERVERLAELEEVVVDGAAVLKVGVLLQLLQVLEDGKASAALELLVVEPHVCQLAVPHVAGDIHPRRHKAAGRERLDEHAEQPERPKHIVVWDRLWETLSAAVQFSPVLFA